MKPQLLKRCSGRGEE